jgi:hypothetical protein
MLTRTIRAAARALTLAAAVAAPLALLPAVPARAQVAISVAFGPPALPVYAQPICPGDGYIWTPGYWAWGPDGYFWVPGTWVRPPRIGYLWTPAYWAWGGSGYGFHPGYWGPHIGFYGGINYGFGYGGVGYEGGYWRGNTFAYNRAVNNINIVNVRNVYDRPVEVRNGAWNHVSYNGGNGGVPYRPSPQEQAALREQHFQPTGEQMLHQNTAARTPQQFARVNGGRPVVTAAPTVSAFRSNPANPAAAYRGGFGAANPNRPFANQREPYQQQRMANGGVLNQQQRQQTYRGQNSPGAQIYRDNRNTIGQSRSPYDQRQQMQPQQRQQYDQRRQMQQRPQMQQGPPRGQYDQRQQMQSRPQYQQRQQMQQQPRQQFEQRQQMQPQARPQMQERSAPPPQSRPAPTPRQGGGHEGGRPR